MRWRDLVRNNMLGEQLYWTFFRYYAAADRGSGYDSPVGEYDFGNGSVYDTKWMNSLYYVNNAPNDNYYSFDKFPQASPNVRVVYIVNPYRLPESGDEKIKIKVDGKDQQVARADYMNWFDENTSRRQLISAILCEATSIAIQRAAASLSTTTETMSELPTPRSSRRPMSFPLCATSSRIRVRSSPALRASMSTSTATDNNPGSSEKLI